MFQQVQQYKENLLSELDENRLEKALFDKMIRQDYEQFLQTQGLYQPEKPKITLAKVRFLPFLKAAAVFLMIGSVGYWYQAVQTPSQNAVIDLEKQVNQELSQTVLLPQTRKEGKVTVAENLQSFQTAYSNHEFEKAAKFIQKMEPKYADDFYYWGLCNLYLPEPQYVIAIHHLQKAADSGKEEAIWYIALAQIKLNDKVSAKQRLKQYLSYGRDWKRNEAETLLKKL